MDKKYLIPNVLLCFLLLQFIGCISSYRIPLKVTPSTFKTNTKYESILLQFEETTKGVPLNETVWSNIKSAYRDTNEINRIGYSQNRSFAVIPIIPIAAITTYKVNSEIIIPFGNIFSQKLKSAFDSCNISASSTYNEEEAKEIIKVKQPEIILKTKIDSFFVWEAPLNHLNFYTVGNVELLNSSSKEIKKYNFKKISLRNKLGGIFSTSNHFLYEMLSYSNLFAEEIVSEVLSILKQ